MEASHRLEVLDPTPERHGGKPEDTAPRLDTLEGKTVGLPGTARRSATWR